MSLAIYIVNALRLLVIVDALASWVQRDSEFPRSVTRALTEPVYGPLRALLSPFTGRFDLTPLAALLMLQLVAFWLRRATMGSGRRQ